MTLLLITGSERVKFTQHYSYDLVTSLVLFARTNMRKTNTSGYIKENLTTFVLLLCNKRSYDLKHVKFKSDEQFTLV